MVTPAGGCGGCALVLEGLAPHPRRCQRQPLLHLLPPQQVAGTVQQVQLRRPLEARRPQKQQRLPVPLPQVPLPHSWLVQVRLQPTPVQVPFG